MTGFPTLGLSVLQGLLAAAILLVVPMAMVFGARLRTSAGDIGLAFVAYAWLAFATIALFWPFEGDWIEGALGPLVPFRALLVGGLVLGTGTALIQRRALTRRPDEAAPRIGAAILVGAAWGATWGFAGWCLQQVEVSRYV